MMDELQNLEYRAERGELTPMEEIRLRELIRKRGHTKHGSVTVLYFVNVEDRMKSIARKYRIDCTLWDTKSFLVFKRVHFTLSGRNRDVERAYDQIRKL